MEGLLYQRQTATEFMMLTELISDAFKEIEGVTWSTNSNEEIGFSVNNKVSKSNLFFGTWFEAWEYYEVPLMFVFEYAEKDKRSKIEEITIWVNEQKSYGLRFIHDFREFSIILVKLDFLNLKDKELKLSQMFKDLCFKLNIPTK